MTDLPITDIINGVAIPYSESIDGTLYFMANTFWISKKLMKLW